VARGDALPLRSEGMKTPPFYGGNVCLEPQTKALLFICFF